MQTLHPTPLQAEAEPLWRGRLLPLGREATPGNQGIKDWAGAYEYGQFSPFGFGGAYYYTRLAYNF